MPVCAVLCVIIMLIVACTLLCCLVSLAVCKVRPTLLDLHKVILKSIPRRENSQRWIEFLTALNMCHEDIPCLVMLLSEGDARWNVNIILDAWLNGGGLQPKTWGTLLSAMDERGTPFLRKLTNAAKEVYLSKPIIHGTCDCAVVHLHSFAPSQESWHL